MQGTPSGSPEWPSKESREYHFNSHRHEYAWVDVHDYDASAREVIRIGKRFTYRDRLTKARRVGYFDPRTGRSTAVSWDEADLLTHFVTDEAYLRGLPGSDYR